MIRKLRLFLPLLAGVSLPGAASTIPAGGTAYQIDPAQTQVAFTLDAVLHTVHGTFRLKRGDIRFDPATGAAAGQLVVDATSGESGNGSRDGKMHKQVLESARYPEIVFRPDRVEGAVAPQGASEIRLHGLFAIHGAEHEMTVPVSLRAIDGGYSAKATFEVPYIAWGMKNPSTLFLRVGDKVEIAVDTVARAAH